VTQALRDTEEDAVEQLLYSPREGAAIIDVGRSKMWELIARGEIESVKIDGLRKIPAEALTTYVERLRAKSASETVTAGH
jgi:excisionase family DNA binding protein